MHDLNVLILGPKLFISSLNELKNFLKFKLLVENLNNNYSIILFHVDALKDHKQKKLIENSKNLKVCASKKVNILNKYDAVLELPATLKDINNLIETTVAKKQFNKNSSIEIKNYLLDKNERKLSKFEDFIILTEKEIQLLELFLNYKKPISKNDILSMVWNYSSDADTHTVETHIYRLRKKIKQKFSDENFIISTKNGYLIN